MRPPFLLLLYTILCDLSSVKYILLYVIFTDTTFYETYNHFYTKEPLGIESESLFCFVLGGSAALSFIPAYRQQKRFCQNTFFQLAFHLFAVRYGTLASSKADFKHIPYCDSNVISSSSFSDKDFNQMYSAGVSMLSSHPYRSPFHTGSSIVTVNCSGNSAYSGDCPSSPPTSSSKLLSQNVCVCI